MKNNETKNETKNFYALILFVKNELAAAYTVDNMKRKLNQSKIVLSLTKL